MNSEHALLIAYLVFSASLIYGAYLSTRLQRPALVVFFGFCLFYLSLRGVMLLSDTYGQFGALHGGREFEAPMLNKVFWISLVFIGAVLLGYGKFTTHKLDNNLYRSIPDSVLNSAFFIVWALSINAMLFASLVGSFRLAFCFVILGGVYYVNYRPRLYPRLLTLLAGISAIAVALMQTIERRDWAVAAASVSLIIILSQSRKIIRMATLSAAMLVVIAFVAIMLRTGDRLSVNDTIERLSAVKAVLPLVEMELDFPLVFDDLTVMMDAVPSRIDYTYGKHFFKPLVSWIPRDVWPSKPDTLSRYFSKELNPFFYLHGGSEPVTFVGELYWNFSLFGVAFALVLGKLIRRIDEYSLGATNLLQYVNSIMLATMMFYVLRGPIDTFWLQFAVYFAGWVLVSTMVELIENASKAAAFRQQMDA
jgi:hypothetical protein